MNRLEREFEEKVDFFHFNIDRREFNEIRDQLGLFRRSTYILLSPSGEEIRTWIGPLEETAMLAQLEELLAAQ